MAAEELLKAVKIIGSQQKLANLLGVSRAVLNHWLNLGIRIPINYALDIEMHTKGKVLAEKLAPHCKETIKAFKQYCKGQGHA